MMVNASLFCRSRAKGFHSPARYGKSRAGGKNPIMWRIVQYRRRIRHAKTPAGLARPTETGSAATGATDGSGRGRPEPQPSPPTVAVPISALGAAGTNIPAGQHRSAQGSVLS
jgi:hypothetical protein